ERLSKMVCILPEQRYGETVGERRPVGRGGPAIAPTPTARHAWAAAGARSGGADGHHLRAQDGHPLGVPAPRDGLWQWCDLLAPLTGVAPGRGVAAVAPRVAQPLGRGGPDRLAAGERGRCA